MRLNIGRLVKADFKQFITKFVEDFESNWFIQNIYNIFFTEDFEGWTLGDFIQIFEENFDNWFKLNIYSSLFIDDLENWFVQNDYGLQFSENFENGGW